MKKLLIGLASILALILLAILVGPLLVPTDSLRARLTTTVHDATGRDLKIAGAIRFRLLPSINITAEGVTFANAPWGSVPEMAKIKSIEIDLRLLPLLGGRFEVAHLILTEPEIDLELGKDGRGNWAFDPPPKPTIATTTASAETRRPAPTIALDDVRLETGRLAFRDHRANSVQTLDHIVVRLVFPGLEGWAAVGAIPLAASAVMARAVARDDRPPFAYALSAAACLKAESYHGDPRDSGPTAAPGSGMARRPPGGPRSGRLPRG